MVKRYLVSVAAALTAAFAYAQSDSLLVVGDVNIVPGQENELSILLKETSQSYTAFQFDMQLPEGIAIAEDEAGELKASLSEECEADHVLVVKNIAPNTYRFLSYSETNDDLYDSDGVLVNVTLSADETVAMDTFSASISDGLLVSASRNQAIQSELSFDVNVVDPTAIQKLSILNSQFTNDNWHNLQGQRIISPRKGVYIRNGKKVVIKLE